MKVSELKPQSVFKYFTEICGIPHGSGNTSALAEYCVDFAKEHDLEYRLDNAGNLVIFKDGTVGYENSPAVILQGHLDMVCDKTEGCTVDMEKDGLRILTDGEYVWADGTTLGGDDGIALAYMLTILASDDIPHPPLEALFTSDEEIGMIGANKLDVSCLKGKKLINIDSEEEGVLITSCAGGVRVKCEIPINYTECPQMSFCLISIGGLKGGHSGIDINRHRKNAIKLMGRLLEYVSRRCEISICSLSGGGKENSIAKYAAAEICFAENSRTQLYDAVNSFMVIVKKELHQIEPDLSITIADTRNKKLCTEPLSTKKIIFALMQIPDGIQAMSPDIPDMVQTSMNLGTVFTDDQNLIMQYLIRSNAATGKHKSVEKLVSFIEYLDGQLDFTSDYPAWEYRMFSPLRDIMVKTYKELFAQVPEVQSIHAGLECGILASKIRDVDMISFGPDMENVHTPEERMGVDSVERCWNYLIAVLKKLK